MNRAERRAIQNKRKRIRKRGPILRDFLVSFSLKDETPYITLPELEKFLPKEYYLDIQGYVEEGGDGTIVDETGEKGLFTATAVEVFRLIKEDMKKRA